MRVIITPAELMEMQLWSRFCEITGTNPWVVNEGLLSSDSKLALSARVTAYLGLLK